MKKKLIKKLKSIWKIGKKQEKQKKIKKKPEIHRQPPPAHSSEEKEEKKEDPNAAKAKANEEKDKIAAAFFNKNPKIKKQYEDFLQKHGAKSGYKFHLLCFAQLQRQPTPDALQKMSNALNNPEHRGLSTRQNQPNGWVQHYNDMSFDQRQEYFANIKACKDFFHFAGLQHVKLVLRVEGVTESLVIVLKILRVHGLPNAPVRNEFGQDVTGETIGCHMLHDLQNVIQINRCDHSGRSMSI